MNLCPNAVWSIQIKLRTCLAETSLVLSCREDGYFQDLAYNYNQYRLD